MSKYWKSASYSGVTIESLSGMHQAHCKSGLADKEWYGHVASIEINATIAATAAQWKVSPATVARYYGALATG
jgi:hypothetical protein